MFQLKSQQAGDSRRESQCFSSNSKAEKSLAQSSQVEDFPYSWEVSHFVLFRPSAHGVGHTHVSKSHLLSSVC